MNENFKDFPENWFDNIESTIIKQYDFLKLKGDIDNSVLAGFVLFNSNKNSLNVISLATGTKLMSGDQRQKTAKIGPALIHDCHAEILSHRGLQAWIWNSINDSNVFECKNDKYYLLPHLSIHFYSSDPPCGDCCVHIAKQSHKSVQNESNDQVQQGNEENKQVDKNDTQPLISVQTGAKPFGWDQNQLFTSPPNIVRGKPGRGSRSQSVSCSDKICLWINCGLQGSLLSSIVPSIKISTISIGNGCVETLHRALIDRISQYKSEDQNESSNQKSSEKVDDKNFDIKDDENSLLRIFVKKPSWEQKNLSPSASAFVWWDGCQKDGELIAAKFGRKLGVTEKKQEDPRMFSDICDAVMLQRYCKYNGIKNITLGDAKSKNPDYNQKKNKIKKILESYGGQWASKFPEEKEWLYNE